MPIGIKGNCLGNYIPPHTSRPLVQTIYNTEGEVVFERDIRTTTSGAFLFTNSEVQNVFEEWNVATPVMTSGSSMFFRDKALKRVSVGADFTSLYDGHNMFYQCSNLESVCVSFPSLVFAYGMFRECTSLKKIPEQLDLSSTHIRYVQRMFQDSGLEGDIGKSGYYDEDGTWHPYEMFEINGPNDRDYTNGYSESSVASTRGMFYGCKNITGAFISMPYSQGMSDMFKNCTSLKKAVILCPKCSGSISYELSGFGEAFCGCSNLEVLDIQSNPVDIHARRVVYNCSKLRYFNLKSKARMKTVNGFLSGVPELVTLGKDFTPSIFDASIVFVGNTKFSLDTMKRILSVPCGSSATSLSTNTYTFGIGLKEGLKRRTTPSYVIDAGYYDYKNGSESTDPTYIHNYFDINGNPVIEHDVHEPYISTEQPTDENGNLLTTWSAENNGVTYWAIGELREALDAALGVRWKNIKITFN